MPKDRRTARRNHHGGKPSWPWRDLHSDVSAPLSPNPPANRRNRPRQCRRTSSMNRVLVVDDDCAMRAALEARFQRRGWLVETAASAGEAIACFRRGMHELIVTDIRMSGRMSQRMPDGMPDGIAEEDGFLVMRAARALVPHAAVILLTAFASVP